MAVIFLNLDIFSTKLGTLDHRLESYQCLMVKSDSTTMLSTKRSAGVTPEVNLAIHCLKPRKHTSEGPNLPLKFRADITTNLKQGPHKKDLCAPIFEIEKVVSPLYSLIHNFEHTCCAVVGSGSSRIPPACDRDIHTPCWNRTGSQTHPGNIIGTNFYSVHKHVLSMQFFGVVSNGLTNDIDWLKKK